MPQPVHKFISAVLLCAVLFCPPVSAAQTRVYRINGVEVPYNTWCAANEANRSEVFLHRNNLSEAMVHLKRALAYDPVWPQTHLMLGVVLGRMGKVDDSAREFRLAAEQNPSLTEATFNLACVYQLTGNFKDALAAYEHVAATATDRADAAAARDHADLLRKEIARQEEAKRKRYDASLTRDSYYANVVCEFGRKRWADSRMPLRVYVFGGAGVNCYSPKCDSILRSAFDEWTKATGGKINFRYVNHAKDADITVRWVDKDDDLSSSAEGGEADWRALNDAMVASKISILLVDADSTVPLSSNLIRLVCLHEIGHSLGLVGHSADPNDVMFFAEPIIDAEKHLSERDVNTIKAIYSQPLNPLSDWLSAVDHQTGGNTTALLRFLSVVAVIVLSMISLVIFAITKTNRKKNKRRKK